MLFLNDGANIDKIKICSKYFLLYLLPPCKLSFFPRSFVACLLSFHTDCNVAIHQCGNVPKRQHFNVSTLEDVRPPTLKEWKAARKKTRKQENKTAYKQQSLQEWKQRALLGFFAHLLIYYLFVFLFSWNQGIILSRSSCNPWASISHARW